MRCDRCGRDNPDNLRFCQDCGNRLTAAEPPAARPAAPAFNFGPPGAAPAPAPPGNHCPRCGVDNAIGGRFCVSCGSGLGAAAAPAPAPAPAPAAYQPPAHHAPAAHQPAGPPVYQAPAPAAAPAARPLQPQPIAGARPAAASAAAAPEPGKVACPRCQGQNAATMTFCQYCGSRLEAAAPAPAPAAPRPAAAPAPAPAPAAAPPRPVAQPEPAPRRASPTAPEGPQARSRGGGGTLVVIAQDGSRGREYQLGDDQTDIGRSEGVIQLTGDIYVSPRHARFVRRGDQYFLRDLGSVNGVFLRIRVPTPLTTGDLLLVGLEVLRFETVTETEQGLGPAIQHGVHVFGSPIATRPARLVQRTVEGISRDIFHLTREETIIGRESGDIVFTSDPFMSRRHASLSRDGGGAFTLRDLGSSNGTYLALRGEVALEPGDHVRIGQHLFRFDLDGRSPS